METLNKLLSVNQNYVLVGLVILFFSVEMLFRPIVYTGSKLKHLATGLLFQVIAILLGSVIALIIGLVFDWIDRNQFGLFNWISIPFWMKVVIGFFLIDLGDYWFHRMDHRVPLFWRFHRVHHSDTMLDASTTLRTFPTEGIYFLIGDLLTCIIFGLDILSENLFLFLIIPAMFVQHASIRYPLWIDKLFGWILVTPNMHKIHHDSDRFYTDSNYGTYFIIWDKLFGTFRTKPEEEINYGLIEFEDPQKQTFWYLLRSPFLKIGKSLRKSGNE